MTISYHYYRDQDDHDYQNNHSFVKMCWKC